MKPHPRIRKTVKWGGLAFTVLLVTAWVVTLQSSIIWASGTGTQVGVIRGVIGVWDFVPRGWSGKPARGWFTAPRIDAMQWWVRTYNGVRDGYVEVPIWMPLVVLGGVTAVAWRLDGRARRTARPGVCAQCGYSLVGLKAGAVCPECGSSQEGLHEWRPRVRRQGSSA